MEGGVRIEIDVADLERVEALVTGLTDFDASELVLNLVARGSKQTQERVESGGPGPDGEAWPPNLEGTPTLMRTGRNLRDSIRFSAHGESGEWGAGFEYAHVHQYGAVITPKNSAFLSFMLGSKRVFAKSVTIPPRPFVGVSSADAVELKGLVTDFLGELTK